MLQPFDNRKQVTFYTYGFAALIASASPIALAAKDSQVQPPASTLRLAAAASQATPRCPLNSTKKLDGRIERFLRDLQRAAEMRNGKAMLTHASRALDLIESCHKAAKKEATAALSRLVSAVRVSGTLSDDDKDARFLQRLAKITETVFGPEHTDVATSLGLLGHRLTALGKYADAEPALDRARAIGETTLGPDHPEVAITLEELALLAAKRTREDLDARDKLYESSEQLYKRSLTIRETALGPEHPDVARSLVGLAGLFLRQKERAPEAEPLLDRALAIREKAFGPEHPNVAAVLAKIAVLRSIQNREAEAEVLYRRALAIQERMHPETVDVAETLRDWARLHSRHDHDAEAERLYKRAMAIFEKAFGPNHPDVAAVLDNLTTFYIKRQRYAEAEAMSQRALATWTKALGPDHPYIPLILNNWAYQYDDQGQPKKAQVLYERVLAINEKAYGPEHERTAISLNNLGANFSDQGRLADAERLYRRALAIREKALGPEHSEVAASLNNLGALFSALGRYDEAEESLKRSLAIKEKAFGPDNAEVAIAMSNLAQLYKDLDRRDEAEQLYTRALAIREKALGPNDPDVARSLHALADVYEERGRYEQAMPLFLRALAIKEKSYGPEHPDVAMSLSGLAALYGNQGRFAEAEPLYLRSLTIEEKALGENNPEVATTLNNIAVFYVKFGRYAKAEHYYKRAWAIVESTFGSRHPHVASVLSNLANFYERQGRDAEAEPLFHRALSIREKAFGSEHSDVARSLSDLASFYMAQGRGVEAEPLFQRALAIAEKQLGPDDPFTSTVLNNLGVLYRRQHRYDESTAMAKKALEIQERVFGADHPQVALAYFNMASSYMDVDRDDDAEAFLKRALAIYEKGLPTEHPAIGRTLNALAFLYRGQGRFEEAEPLFARALEIQKKSLPPDHPDTAMLLDNIAMLHLWREDWKTALGWARRATDSVIRRFQAMPEGAGTNVLWRARTFLGRRLLTLARVSAGEPDGETIASLRDEAFRTAQYMLQTTAAKALAQTTVRLAAPDSALGALVRERQDLQSQREAVDRQLTSALALRADRRDGADERARARLGEIDARLSAVAIKFGAEFPAFSFLTNPKPLSIAEAARLLSPDEALVFFAAGSERSYVFGVTKDAAEWREIPLEFDALAQRVQTLKQRIDVADGSARGLAEADKGIPNVLPRGTVETDMKSGHRLYRVLFGSLGKLLDGKKHLIIVPDGPLTGLPFQLLVKEAPSADTTFKTAHWLIKDAAISVLPEVSSLQALRDIPRRPETASVPFIGFGNPALRGGSVRVPCPDFNLDENKPNAVASLGMARARDLAGLAFSGGGTTSDGAAIADVEWLRGQPSLPETRCELEQLAALGGTGSVVYAGNEATETKVKELSKNGELKKYRMLAFATHGLLPDRAGGEDDVQAKSSRESPREIAITEVMPNTTAERVQLRVGDRILAYNGNAGLDTSELASLATDLTGPATRALLIRRGTETLTFEVPAGRLGVRIENAPGKSITPTAEIGKPKSGAPIRSASLNAPKPTRPPIAEAGLILTPPAKGDDKDDGLLTASEVATLDLDADWVILSACNTAAGDKPGAASLSGLARAFFYAGARSLLVSHWPVDSRAAVLLTTRTLRAMEQDPTIGKAEALRQAMLSFLAADVPASWSDPRVWAPFSLVGEGGR